MKKKTRKIQMPVFALLILGTIAWVFFMAYRADPKNGMVAYHTPQSAPRFSRDRAWVVAVTAVQGKMNGQFVNFPLIDDPGSRCVWDGVKASAAGSIKTKSGAEQKWDADVTWDEKLDAYKCVRLEFR